MLGQHVYIEMDEGQEDQKTGIWLGDYYIVDADTEKPICVGCRFPREGWRSAPLFLDSMMMIFQNMRSQMALQKMTVLRSHQTAWQRECGQRTYLR